MSLGTLFPNLGHVSIFLLLTGKLRGTGKKRKTREKPRMLGTSFMNKVEVVEDKHILRVSPWVTLSLNSCK